MEVLKVSSKSNPNSVAGALAGIIREQGAVEMQTVGAGALNQAIKAVAIARGLHRPFGYRTDVHPCVRRHRDQRRRAHGDPAARRAEGHAPPLVAPPTVEGHRA